MQAPTDLISSLFTKNTSIQSSVTKCKMIVIVFVKYLLLFAGMRICTIDVKLFDINGPGQRLTRAYVTNLPFTQLGTSTNKYSKNLEQTETKYILTLWIDIIFVLFISISFKMSDKVCTVPIPVQILFVFAVLRYG
ncbi:hypothetical protein T02_10449 [Trichinella nativa]|uniref:Uncharacterized protein n=1 Tax=Trichinella nativa TaxID=6335 RepID=A0A0V1LCH3_9BILA|nr:hypothetical protein T02_10449 [Trichinella nativa]